MSDEVQQPGFPYNPHQLVTLRDINDGVESFNTFKATDLEYKLEERKDAEKRLIKFESLIDQITSHMTLDEWYSDYKDKDEVLEALADILGISPTASINLTVTVEISMSAEVPIKEMTDFDAETFVTDELQISAYGSVDVDDWTIQSADWEEA